MLQEAHLSRVGRAYRFHGCVAVVVSDLGEPRWRGSTLTDDQCAQDPLPKDAQVYTLIVIGDSVTYPVERLEAHLKEWEIGGRMI